MNTFDWNHYTNFVTFHTCEHIYWDAIFSDPPSPKSAENKKVDLPAIIYFLYFNMASILLLNFLPHWNSLIFSTLLPLILKTAARTPRHIGFLLEEETFSRWRRTGETCSSTFSSKKLLSAFEAVQCCASALILTPSWIRCWRRRGETPCWPPPSSCLKQAPPSGRRRTW